MKTWAVALLALPACTLAKLERRAADGHFVARRGHRVEARQPSASAPVASRPSSVSGSAVASASASAVAADCASFQTRAAPINVAPGALTPAQGCSRYYNATASSNCLNILENSGSGLSLEHFQQLNPSVGGACWGVWVDSAYCVAVTQCVADTSRSAAQDCTRFAQVTNTTTTVDAFALAQNLTFSAFQQLNPNTTRSAPLDLYSFYCVSDLQIDFAASSSTSADTIAPATDAVAEVRVAAVATSSQDAPSPAWSPSSAPEPVWSPSPAAAQWVAPTTSSAGQWTSSAEQQWTSPTQQQQAQAQAQAQTQWTPTTSSEQNTWTAQATSSAKQVAAVQPAQNNGGRAMGHGQATFFAPGLGSCGGYNSASDYIFAASATLYEMVGGNALCGASVTVTRPSDGKTVTGTIVDKCPSGECTPCSLDMSPAAFNAIADPAEGRVAITWNVNSLPFSSSVLAAVAAACGAN